MNANIEKKNRTRRRVVNRLSFIRLTKILDKDRVSASESESYLEKIISLPETFNYRIISIKEDSSNKIIK